MAFCDVHWRETPVAAQMNDPVDLETDPVSAGLSTEERATQPGILATLELDHALHYSDLTLPENSKLHAAGQLVVVVCKAPARAAEPTEGEGEGEAAEGGDAAAPKADA